MLKEKANPENLKKWVYFLAKEIGPRSVYYPKLLSKVAESIAKELESFGLIVNLKDFTYREHQYYNVEALINNKDLYNNKKNQVVIGAHYDTVKHSPGADDNASGVAGLIELSRLLCNFDAPIRFVAFSLEEPPVFGTQFMGSYVYAKSLRESKIKLKGMICLEMLGYFCDKNNSQRYPIDLMKRIYPDKGNFIALIGNLRSRKWTKLIKEGFKKGTDLGVESLNVPTGIIVGTDLSDHKSFNAFGYNAVMVTDTAFYRNPNYHRPTDLPHTLDYEKFAKVIDGLNNAVRYIFNN